MEQAATKFWYLKNLEALRTLPEKEKLLIDEYSRMSTINKGDVLYMQGASDKRLYLLKKGAVKITRFTPEGKEVILDIIKEGSLFGEMAVVDQHERDESAIVVDDGLICALPVKDFEKMVEMIPGLSITITKTLGERKRRLENKLVDLTFCTVEQRLAKTLLHLVESFGVPQKDGYKLDLKLTHKDYADLIASTRETITVTFHKLKNEGLIGMEGKHVVVSSKERMKTFAEKAC